MTEWIDSPDALRARLSTLSAAGGPTCVGLDTEFIRERTYWPQLALVQIALGDPRDPHASGAILLVDPLVPGMPGALAPLLADPAVLKLMHSPSEDLVAFQHACGVLPVSLFDTQAAAALCGIGAGIGYQKLVQEVAGVALEKGETRSDWMRRPLSASQLEYAADDVRHLHALHHALHGKLEVLGRSGWLAEDSARQLANAGSELGDRWPHLGMRSSQFLDAASQRRLLRLLRWRDAQARRSDRPRSWILDNELAATLARSNPADPAALQAQLDATPKSPRSLRDSLWEALVTPLADEDDAPLSRGDDRDKKQLRAMQEAVLAVAAELGVPEGLLASRKVLEALQDGGGWTGALAGWRRHVLEPQLGPLIRSGGSDAASV